LAADVSNCLQTFIRSLFAAMLMRSITDPCV
jgi:hypothetical protein